MLTVASVAYPLAPVGPDAVGGAEQVLYAIDGALVEAGHRSIVIACEGSRCRGELIASGPLPVVYDAAALGHASLRQRRLLESLLAREHVDVVHLHGLDFGAYADLAERVPTAVTLHLPPHWYSKAALLTPRARLQFVCVSRSQRRACPELPSKVHVIPNGVDLDALRPLARKRDFALALGRICPEKGFEVAIEAAKRAGMPLLLGGAAFPYPEHRRYLEEHIRPLLDEQRRWLGPLPFARKRRLLAAARCLLVPSRVPETSSLVAMEALACGTPVVASPAGALCEIVEHGRTGFLVEDDETMAAALDGVSRLSPAACRQAAEARFSAAESARRYLALFDELARPRALVRRARPRGLEVRLEARLAAIEALAPEWSELWERSPSATVFQRPEWLLPWIHEFAAGTSQLLAVRDGAKLVALAPLHVRRGPGGRELALAGAGNSDYVDAIAEPAYAELVLPLLVRHAARGGIGRVSLDCLPAASPLLTAPVPAGCKGERELETVCPFLPLDGLDRAAPLDADVAKQLRRALHRVHGLELRWESGRCTREVDAHLAALFELHAARWRAKGQGGVLDPSARRFLRMAAHRLHGAGMLLSWALRIGGRLVAVMIGFRDRGCDRYYLGGFDPAYKRCSPGALLFERAILQAAADGMGEVDFLRGREPYKYRFATAERPLYRRELVLEPGSPIGDRP